MTESDNHQTAQDYRFIAVSDDKSAFVPEHQDAEEEVITIGAEVVERTFVEDAKTDDIDKEIDDAATLSEPAPMARRIVMTLCAFGFLLIVIYVLQWWGVIKLPF